MGYLLVHCRHFVRAGACHRRLVSCCGKQSSSSWLIHLGYLTNSDWRWCFAINLPVGVLALIISFVLLRKLLLGPQPIPELDETISTGRRTKLVARLKTVDVGGQLLFLFGFGLVILSLTWGGANHPWASAAVIVPLVIGLLLCGVFIYWEYLLVPGHLLAVKMPWQRPMLPWSLISYRDVGLLFYTECATGMGMYAVSFDHWILIST